MLERDKVAIFPNNKISHFKFEPFDGKLIMVSIFSCVIGAQGENCASEK